MGESIKTYGLVQPRLDPQSEHRWTGWEIDGKTGLPKQVSKTFIIGHGQQLARERLGERFEMPVPRGTMGRQQVRRTVAKAAKKAAARIQDRADLDALKAMRAARQPYQEIIQGPGKLLPSGRPYKKSAGKAFRSVTTLASHPRLGDLPGYEVTFHATKGLRVQRIAA